MRVLKVEGFGNFTYSAIAVALAGFGASGTLIFIFRDRLLKNEKIISLYSNIFLIFFIGSGYFLSKKISFDPLQIVWDKNQFLRLLIRYALYVIPFILGASIIIIAFSIEKAGRIYFYNLLGSGFGVFIILLSLYFISPKRIFIIPLFLALLSEILLFSSMHTDNKHIITAFIFLVVSSCLFIFGDINVIPYKGVKLALNVPRAKVIAKKHSPFGTIEVVKSSQIRIAQGLSLSFKGELPDQHGLFIDGDTLSAIDNIKSNNSLYYLKYQSQSTIYKIYHNPEVFLIGLGGGTGIERAYINNAKKIVCSEVNSNLAHLLKDTFKDYNNNFFNNNIINIINEDGRSYLKKSKELWDIIELSEADTYSSSIGGIYSADTNYMLTVEAIKDYICYLKKNGTVSLTVWLKYPPRALLKLVSLSKRAMGDIGIDCLKNIVVIRSWSNGTVLIKKEPFNTEELTKIKLFCNSMFFDLVYYPGIKKNEVNKFNIVKDALYYKYVSNILYSSNKDSFIKNYLFKISPSTDNAPYFSQFFKLKKIPVLIKDMGKKWLPVVEGGYLVIFFTFIATVFLSFILILLPLLLKGQKIKSNKASIIIYFSSIALAYMFIEITLMERFNKLLSNPIYSNSIILASLMIFSGIGSYFSDIVKINGKRLSLYAVIFISGYLLLFTILSENIFSILYGSTLFNKLIFTIAVISPLSFFMGIPFPTAISRIKHSGKYSLPWAWSINGYFSVVASSGVTMLSLNIGLQLIFYLAILLYILAIIFYPE